MKKVAVIGAGISGLFIANLFKRDKKYQVTIFERNSLNDLKAGYGIQLSVNSIKLLNKIQFDKLENSEKFNPDKINFYSIKNFNENLNFKMSNMNMNIKIQYLKNAKRFPSSYWFDKRKLDNHMLPTFTKKVVKYLEKK